MEIVLRWGDTLLEVIRADDFALDDTPLVSRGEAIAAPVGAVGPIAYELRAASAVEPLPPPRRDLRALPYLGLAAAVHVAAVMWALSTPTDEPEPPANMQTRHGPQHRARIAPAPLVNEQGADDRGHAMQGHARAMDGEVGAIGAPMKTPPAGQIAIANTGELPQLTREQAIEQARHAGIFGSPTRITDSLASLVGHDPVTSGFDEYSATAAREYGKDAGGGFGFARTGFGSGGGGTSGNIGWGTIGMAHSDGTSNGHGFGGRGTIRDESWGHGWDGPYIPVPHIYLRRQHLQICDGDVRDLCSVTGALDPSMVRRIVRREIAKLSYCFEKYQLGHPKEKNRTVVLEMDIDSTVMNETVRGDAIEITECVGETVKAMQFPKGATHALYYLRYHD